VLDLAFSSQRRDFAVEIVLSVEPGERVALFGPSGAGKSTVLETIAGFLVPTSGSVFLNGRALFHAAAHATSPRARPANVPTWQRRVGLLRQRSPLFPHLNVASNLAYDGAGLGGDTQERNDLARMIEIDDLLQYMPAALSGGQAQRVAICRLLLGAHDALLLDEPYAGLDRRLRRVVTDVVRDHAKRYNIPTILVAHELEEAQACAERIVVIDAGRVLQDSSTHEIVRRPASRRVAELVGYRSFVNAPDGRGVFGVHPDRVVAGAYPDRGVVLSGRVIATRAAGARFEIDLVMDAIPAAQSAFSPSASAHSVAGSLLVCELDEPPGDRLLSVTAIDAPRFAGPDLLLVEPGSEPTHR
jgi:ABC-type sulfate/molybdate transport systems ATPase subunit